MRVFLLVFFCVEKKNFLAFLSSLLKWQIYIPHGVLRTALKFGLREVIELVPVFTSSKQRRERKFNVAFVQILKKSALHVQNLLFLFTY